MIWQLIRGVGKDARVVAAARMAVGLVAVAIIGALQTLLASPDLSAYAWVPVALLGLRVLEGFFDHADPQKPG